MDIFDFIPVNNPERTTAPDADSARVVEICKAFITKNSFVYDGRNPYAPKVGVCMTNDCRRTFATEKEAKENGFRFLFYPTTEEIRTALAEFKKRGYLPYYDNDVCYYGYVKDRSEISGEFALKHTVWL